MFEKNFYGLFSSGFLEIVILFFIITFFVILLTRYLPEPLRNREAIPPTIKNSLIYKHIVLIILIILFLISFVLKVDNLSHPGRYFFDENFFAFTAQEMAKGNPLGWQKGERAPGKVEYEWTHPPLGKELTAVGILIFGDKPFSWRIIQALFGALGTVFIFFLAKELFISNRAGIFASFLYTFESFIFVMSRIAMVDIFLLNFVLLASLFFVKYARNNNIYYLVLSALFCGAAMSVKWTGVLTGLFLFSLSVFILVYRQYFLKNEKSSIFLPIFKVAAIFLFIPAIVYLMTYIPFFLNGNSFTDFLSSQLEMYSYHTYASKLHVYRSEWWTWPLLYRPICLYIEKIGSNREYIYSLGNPVIWWSGIIFLIISAYYSVKNKHYPLMFVVIGFLAFWLPWAVSPRKITYIYHYLPSLLFVILAISYFLNKLWDFSLKAKFFVAYFLICVVAAFLFFHPILTGEEIPKQDMKSYRWLKSWI